MSSDSNLIIVTGYGIFKGHDVNASGEAVKLLPEKIDVQGKTYEIRKIFIEVEYEDVDRRVDEIWKMKPFLVIHCGN
jgi:pyrrolidone-carboxylate peptidase